MQAGWGFPLLTVFDYHRPIVLMMWHVTLAIVIVYRFTKERAKNPFCKPLINE
jgi:hypothetical protein